MRIQRPMFVMTFILHRCFSYSLRCDFSQMLFQSHPLRHQYHCQSIQRMSTSQFPLSAKDPTVKSEISEPSLSKVWSSDLPSPEMDCWRPTLDDVDRISWGKPAKKKSTGSRGVPHRLNEEERKLYDFGRQKGFLEIPGSGWRKERRGAPLLNSYRNW